MTRSLEQYESAGAIEAAEGNGYRTNIVAQDGVDLSARISGVPLRPTNRNPNLAVSVRFLNTTDSADIVAVFYQGDPDGDPVPMHSETIVGLAPSLLREIPTGPYLANTVIFDTGGCGLWEIRIRNLTGAIPRIRAWTY